MTESGLVRGDASVLGASEISKAHRVFGHHCLVEGDHCRETVADHTCRLVLDDRAKGQQTDETAVARDERI